ncbi:MAG: T9SS type A sorting domain-containing protein, partial [Lewinella sp.]|nr:T9SS type A sorting domain-containing protein [Lewinella sp.]
LTLEVLDEGGIACAGDTTGFFETIAEGGTPPYTYNWLGKGVSTSNIYGLGAGLHTLSVTDSRGCPLETVLELTDPAPLLVQASFVVGDLCDADDPDRLQVVASGGTDSYTYLWSDSTTVPVIENPFPGNYNVSVTDANGCTAVDGTIKVQNRIPPLQLDTFYVEPVSCFGGSDASMTALTLGGSGLLEYHFTPTRLDTTSADSLQIAGLPHAQTYSVTVTDLVTGCQVVSPQIHVQQPMPIAITRDSFQVVSCFGAPEGAIFVSVTGGTGPYAYSWMDTNGAQVSTEQDLQLVEAGAYELLVTDLHGCTAHFMDSSVVAINPPILIESLLMDPVDCRGGNTGSLDLTIAGGVPPYTYVWSNMATTEDITDLTAGVYQLTVTDSDTCRVIFPDLLVSQPATELTVEGLVDSISCFGAADGQIALLVAGGGAPYLYTWRRGGSLWPSQTDSLVVNLPANQYQVMVRDTNGCVRSQSFTLSDPPLLEVDILNQPTGADSLLALAAGGRPPWSYLWSTGDTSMTIRMLESGNYQVTVVDASGCTSSTTFMLTSVVFPREAGADFQVFPNPFRDGITIVRNQPAPGAVDWTLLNGQGQRLRTGSWPALQREWLLDLAQYPAGLYWLRLEEAGRTSTVIRLIKLE